MCIFIAYDNICGRSGTVIACRASVPINKKSLMRSVIIKDMYKYTDRHIHYINIYVRENQT